MKEYLKKLESFRKTIPQGTRQLILRMDAVEWILKNHRRIARFGGVFDATGELIGVKLSSITVDLDQVPKSLHPYLNSDTLLAAKYVECDRTFGRGKSSRELWLTGTMIKLDSKDHGAWKRAGLPGLTQTGKIDIDEYLAKGQKINAGIDPFDGQEQSIGPKHSEDPQHSKSDNGTAGAVDEPQPTKRPSAQVRPTGISRHRKE